MPVTTEGMLAVNINREAIVHLTDHGRRVLTEHYRSLGLKPPVHIPAIFPSRDVYRAPLWDLMHVFGRGLYMGCGEVPFVNNEITLLPE